jgi:glycosyltransferase involved in cell wall biosynthesis
MNPLFSIIIPTYNRATLLSDTIKSVQNQTYTKWECIVVDDGSTDNTKEIVESLIQNDNRIKYVYQENAERSAARNNGIRNSSGDYICFLDSDDHYLPNNLSNLAEFILKSNEPVCLTIYQALNISKEEEIQTYLDQPTKNVIEYLYLNPTSPSRACIHSRILKDFQFDEDIVIVEDVIMWMKIASKYPVFVSNHVGVKYNIHEENSVNRKGNGSLKMYQGVILAKSRYRSIFKSIPRTSYCDWTSRIITNVAYYHYLNNRKLVALYWLIKAIKMKPIHKQTKMRISHIFYILTLRPIEL